MNLRILLLLVRQKALILELIALILIRGEKILFEVILCLQTLSTKPSEGDVTLEGDELYTRVKN